MLDPGLLVALGHLGKRGDLDLGGLAKAAKLDDERGDGLLDARFDGGHERRAVVVLHDAIHDGVEHRREEGAGIGVLGVLEQQLVDPADGLALLELGCLANSSRMLRVTARRMSVSMLILLMPAGMAALSSVRLMP